MRQQREDLGRLTGIRQRHHDILARDHADIAVAGLGRMQEERRRTGAGQRRRDLSADMAGLAHAGHHHATAAVEA